MTTGIYVRKPFSEEHKRNMSLCKLGSKNGMFGKKANESFILANKERKAEKNNMWKGDKVSYSGLHYWIKRNKPKPINNECEHCKISTKRLQASNISGKYLRDINDFEWLCAKCHCKYDEAKRFKIGEFTKQKALQRKGVESQ